MNDYDLLDFASRALGGISFDRNSLYFVKLVDGVFHEWNPLEDDGDALHLAMKLGICIQFIPECDTSCAYQEHPTTGEPFNVHSAALGDIETRRVITQAAAEIGKAMQDKH